MGNRRTVLTILPRKPQKNCLIQLGDIVMKSKQPTSKREFRDGVSTKPAARKPQAKHSGSLKAQTQAAKGKLQTTDKLKNTTGSEQSTPKVRVARAKKLVVRSPNQKIQDRVRDLKDKRVDAEYIEPVRLQKALAASGVGSRREMEEWIAQGLVKINGRVAGLGEKVAPGDQVLVKGQVINLKWADRLPRVILYYKQEGEIVSRDDPQGRVSIFDRLPQAASSRWVAIGRLDINTSGLLILTTSGELVQRFAHPSFEVEREYAVRVLGELTTEQMKMLTEEGVMLEDGLAKVERIYEQGGEGANKWYNVVIKEGRNREVRRIFESQGLTVSRLVRVGFGPIGLPNRLKRGQFYELNPAEVANIMKWADMPLPGERRRKK